MSERAEPQPCHHWPWTRTRTWIRAGAALRWAWRAPGVQLCVTKGPGAVQGWGSGWSWGFTGWWSFLRKGEANCGPCGSRGEFGIPVGGGLLGQLGWQGEEWELSEDKSHQALALYCPHFFVAINMLCTSNPLCPPKEQLLTSPPSSQGIPGFPAHHQEPGMSPRVGNTTGNWNPLSHLPSPAR